MITSPTQWADNELSWTPKNAIELTEENVDKLFEQHESDEYNTVNFGEYDGQFD